VFDGSAAAMPRTVERFPHPALQAIFSREAGEGIHHGFQSGPLPNSVLGGVDHAIPVKRHQVRSSSLWRWGIHF
jgi:hypothetical protein